MSRHPVRQYADMLVRIAALPEADRRLWLAQFSALRTLPETSKCPRVERDWGRAAS